MSHPTLQQRSWHEIQPRRHQTKTARSTTPPRLHLCHGHVPLVSNVKQRNRCQTQKSLSTNRIIVQKQNHCPKKSKKVQKRMSTNQLTWSHRLAACLRLVSLRAKYIRTTICILITAHTCRRMPLNHLQRKQNGEKSREIEGNRGKSREMSR